MSLSRPLTAGLVALAWMAAAMSASAQTVQIRGTYNGVPLPPNCAPPATSSILLNMVSPPIPARLQARFACDTGTPSRPLDLTCLPTELGGAGTGVSASYAVRTGASAVNELFVECPNDASTVVNNLDVIVGDLFPSFAAYLANPAAGQPEAQCLNTLGGTVTRISYRPATRILSFDCQTGATTETVACFTWTDIPQSSPNSSSGLAYPVNNGRVQADDCIGFGPNNDQAGNAPTILGFPFADGFEPGGPAVTAIAIGTITPAPANIGQPYSVPVTVSAITAPPQGVVLVSDAAGANCEITLSAAGTGACSLASSSAGTRTIRASFLSSPGFAGSTITTTQDIQVGGQTITFNTPTSITYSPSGTLTLSATGGGSGNPVTFASTTPTRCTVSGNTLTTVSATPTGQFCSITADQAGNASYTAAPQVSRNVTINRAAQVIDFPDPGQQRFGQTFNVSATGGGSGNPIVYSSTDSMRCTVSGSTVTPVAVAVCTIRAQQGGNSNYDAATPFLRPITIIRGLGSLTFPAQPARSLAAGTFPLTFTAGPSTGQVTFVSLTPSVCTMASATTVNPTQTGVCTISGTHESDAFYEASATIDNDIVINP